MSPVFKHASAALAAALLAGCGDPLADGAYPGEPLLRLTGRLEGDARTSNLRAPYIGIVWFAFDFRSGEEVPRVVTSLVPVPDATFPGDFQLELYDPPPPEAFGDLFGVRVAMGAIVALDDVDGDGRFSMDPETGKIGGTDRFFGSTFWFQYLAYVEDVADPVCAEATWTNPGALAAGRYQLASVDECSIQFTVLPEGTPIRLILFPTTPALPDAPPNHVEPGCEVDGEIEVDCTVTPDHPMCRALEDQLRCQLETCGGPGGALDACTNARCLEDPDFEGCIARLCGAESEALSACMWEHCTGSGACGFW